MAIGFELPLEAILKADHEHDARDATVADAAGDGTAGLDQTGLVTIVCEPIPDDRNLLRTDPAYHHFRTIYEVLRTLNEQVSGGASADAVKIVMAAKSTEVPKYFRLYADQICCIIFGPNFPTLSEVAVRIMANSIRNRRVVVCHNPVNAGFSWDRMTELGRDFGIIGYRSSIDANGARNFWTTFFLEELKPLVEERLAAARAGSRQRTLPSTAEVRGLLANDVATLDALPVFPASCRKVIAGVDAGADFPEIEEILRPDAALTQAIVKTANLSRFGAVAQVNSLGEALPLIGLDETRKIIAVRAMRDLAGQVNQEGFDPGAFQRHCTGVGFLAEILSLDPTATDSRARGRSLGLKPYVRSVLTAAGWWHRFDLEKGFDIFSAGLLHDIGKIFNISCYPGILPLIHHEIDQGGWKSPLLDSEGAVVWDFQHPGTGSALLAEWDLFPGLVEPVHHHHRINADSAPVTVLIALANCLIKGLYPFPARIAIPDEFRASHLDPVAAPAGLDNPLPQLFQTRVDLFRLEMNRLLISAEEVESGEYAPAKVEGMIAIARPTFENHYTYIDWLVGQNPEFLDVCSWLEAEPEEVLGLGLVLRESLVELVAGQLAA